MIEPAEHPDEHCRIAALHELGVLDTPPEERFDRITRLARSLFEVPIVLVSLVDGDRQWFKSRVGLEATQTTRAISFCGHAVLHDRIFVVPDAELDTRFRDNPLVLGDPHIRFYAGCPLHSRDGYLVGTLCVIDRKPRHLSDEQFAALRDLGSLVEDQLTQATQATRDELTGLVNRRGFTMVANHVLAEARRRETGATLLYFDLDGFKAINDRLGHAMGDKALVDFGAALGKVFRESDVATRLSGDEFCVLLGTSFSDVSPLLTRLDQELEVTTADAPYRLRYSVGIANYAANSRLDVTELLAEADASMYRAKAQGARQS